MLKPIKYLSLCLPLSVFAIIPGTAPYKNITAISGANNEASQQLQLIDHLGNIYSSTDEINWKKISTLPDTGLVSSFFAYNWLNNSMLWKNTSTSGYTYNPAHDALQKSPAMMNFNDETSKITVINANGNGDQYALVYNKETLKTKVYYSLKTNSSWYEADVGDVNPNFLAVNNDGALLIANSQFYLMKTTGHYILNDPLDCAKNNSARLFAGDQVGFYLVCAGSNGNAQLAFASTYNNNAYTEPPRFSNTRVSLQEANANNYSYVMATIPVSSNVVLDNNLSYSLSGGAISFSSLKSISVLVETPTDFNTGQSFGRICLDGVQSNGSPNSNYECSDSFGISNPEKQELYAGTIYIVNYNYRNYHAVFVGSSGKVLDIPIKALVASQKMNTAKVLVDPSEIRWR